ncbi:MAG: CHAD domain-containing protein [Anaerolineales bacterium]
MDATAQTLIVNALEQRWETYRTQLKACRSEFSEEAVHDLRVAARRMLALIEVLRGTHPHPRLQKLRRAFKNQLDSFDDLRDTQVMLVEISENLHTLPELAALQKYLQKREKRLLRAAEKQVQDFETGGMARRVSKCHESLLAEPTEGLAARILQVVDDAFLTVTQRYRWIDPAQAATIHRVRVAFKKFRYMVEVIHPLLPDFPPKLLKRLHAYQTAMGDIQDVEVFLQTHADFAAREPDYDPHPVRLFYERRHAELITTFIQDMHEVHTFWRATPEHPFPWEMPA